MKSIRLSFSQESINNAIKQVEHYKRSLANKNEEFVRKLAELGIDVARVEIMHTKGDADKPVLFETKVNSFGLFKQAIINMSGQEVLFIEFGAGVHFNGPAGSSPHPKGEEFGYVIGSYGYGQGTKDYWYYVDESGARLRSYGTEASMPMYKASLAIMMEIQRIAKEVYGSWS